MNLISQDVPLVTQLARWESKCVDSIGKRIKHAMKARGLKTNALDRAINPVLGRSVESTGYASKLSNDKVSPSSAVMIALCEVLKVNADWLLTGTGPRDRGAAQYSISAAKNFEEELAKAREIAGPEYSDETWDVVSTLTFSQPVTSVSPRDLYELAKIAARSGV